MPRQSWLMRAKGRLALLAAFLLAGYLFYQHPPLTSVGPTEVGVRVNRLTGEVSQWRNGSVLVVPGVHDAKNPLAARCTYGLVWSASASLNREANALALAVQPTDAWRELWVFRKEASGWALRILPPAALSPGVGYTELAGWVPGGRQMLVAREAKGDGKYRCSFELVRLDTLATLHQATDPSVLPAFRRWQDPAWRRETVSIR